MEMKYLTFTKKKERGGHITITPFYAAWSAKARAGELPEGLPPRVTEVHR